MLVVQSNNQGVPFVLANPNAPISQDMARSRRRNHGPGARRLLESPVTCRMPRPIGVFDSGVGGLTVLREILRRLPDESTIYLGDNGRAPYGTRPDDEVRDFSAESLDALADHDVKAIVVACNTSTAVALPDLRRRYDLPILGVIRPGASAAALATRSRRVGVIATPATVRSHAYFFAIKEENPAVEVYEHATPALVPLVEAGDLTGPTAGRAVVGGAGAAPGRARRPRRVHLPAASLRADRHAAARLHALSAAAAAPPGGGGERVAIVDSASATASALAELLSVNGLETTPGRSASHVQYTTGDVDGFRALAGRLFGSEFPDVQPVELRAAVS